MALFTHPLFFETHAWEEACLRTFSDLVVLNASDGVAIEGTILTQLSDYLKENQRPLAPIDFLLLILVYGGLAHSLYT